ncbi:MAG TPA: ABC transporter ATP-binding protein [Egibacteraceae bacterium]|nr:ABC transporter ATP-binding protein [Egibacteraceae bacterium]
MPNLMMPERVLPEARQAKPLVVQGLSKAFDGASVLRSADLQVEDGSIVALLGSSGCGKTTLLRCIAGLEHPDAGRIRLADRDLNGPGAFVPAERRHVGMVFQDWALFPHMTVGRNVGFGLTPAERRSGRVEEALALVELTGLADRMPAGLSGGQQQRVALARALATRPAVMLLDEPFSNLDAGLRTQIRSEVHRLLQRLQITTVFVTHDQEEAFVVGDEVAVMERGAIVQQAAPAELYDAPATRWVAEFVGDANMLPGTASGRRAETIVGVVPLRSSLQGSVDVMLRPEYLTLSPGGDSVVDTVEYYGHDALYLVTPPTGPSPVRARVLAAPSFRTGDRVTISYSGGQAVGFPSAGA